MTTLPSPGNVADMNRNSNTEETQSMQCTTNNYIQNVACGALNGNTMKEDIFDVGTDVLDVAMRAFTLLVQIQKEQTRGDSVSIPVASWETACCAHGLTPKQFLQAKAYCTALHLYEEQEGEVVLEKMEEYPMVPRRLLYPNELLIDLNCGGKSDENT